jgi:gliding motility-associated-like protein
VLDVVPEIITSATVNTDAGTYTDDISFTEGLDVNYDITYEPADFRIYKAMLTITADDKERVYGNSNPELTFTYNGFVLGENESLLESNPVINTIADQYSASGIYDIIVSGGDDENYQFDYKSSILTIIKADQTITFDEIPAELRTSQEHFLTAVSTSGLDVEFETTTNGTAEIFINALTILKEGVITVVASQPGDNNWNPAPNVVQTITSLPTFDNITSLFTPNNDGMNDYWYIPSIEEYGRVQVKIYNRFGNLVYSSASYENDWDGTWNGKELPSASYYYIINSAEKGVITGTVNILR